MPTPIEILLDPISLIVIAMYLLLMIWEALFPAKVLPKVQYWQVKGLISFVVYFYLSSYLPLLIDPYMEPLRLFDLSALGLWGATMIGILLYELAIYVYHRAVHHFDVLWRVFHQMHHSAERLDTFGAFFFSPVDMIGFTFLGSICFSLLIGISPQAITLVILITNFFAIFQHANIKTPRWIGYLMQRPESHNVHHGKGLHKYNYADLPIIDIIFGTFYNPKSYENDTGFYNGASNRVLEMLTFRDVSKPSE